MMSKRAPFADVLRHRPFFFLLLGQVTSQLAANVTLFLLALIVYQTTGSNTAVSGLFIAYGIPALLFGLLAGTIVDYVDKRLIIFYSCIIRAFLVLFLIFSSQYIVIVYILLFLNAIVTQLFVPAEATMIPRLVSNKLLLPANSLFSFAYYASMAVGFIAAGPMLRFFGPTTSLTILAVLFTLSSMTASRLPGDVIGHKAFWKKLKSLDFGGIVMKVVQSLQSGISYVRENPVLMDSVLLLTGTQIIIVILGTLGPGFADRIMGIDVRDASLLIIGPVVVGILVGAMWIGNKGVSMTTKKLIERGIIGAGTILIIISLTVYMKRFSDFGFLFVNHIIIPLEVLFFFLLGFFNSMLDVPANSILQKEAEGDMRGRVYGVLTACVGGIGILPVLLGGVLADVIGVGKVILFLGIGILLYGIYRLRYNKK